MGLKIDQELNGKIMFQTSVETAKNTFFILKSEGHEGGTLTCVSITKSFVTIHSRVTHTLILDYFIKLLTT